MSGIALAWSKMVVLVSEDVETTPNLIKAAGRTLAVTGFAGTFSLESVYGRIAGSGAFVRSEEHTSELQSP